VCATGIRAPKTACDVGTAQKLSGFFKFLDEKMGCQQA
jgi:hypothetical protein